MLTFIEWFTYISGLGYFLFALGFIFISLKRETGFNKFIKSRESKRNAFKSK